MRMNTHSKAVSLGFPYIAADRHESPDRLVWFSHFCKTADRSDPGIFIGWNQAFHCWVVEQPK